MAKLPNFTNEQEESDFWDAHDSTDFLQETTSEEVTFIDARPHKTQISLRLDPETIARLKEVARSRGVGYQTLIRMWVVERLKQES